MRKPRARRKAMGVRVLILVEAKPNAGWSLDLVYDSLPTDDASNADRLKVCPLIGQHRKWSAQSVPGKLH